MNIFEILSSISVVAMIAFVFTLGIVIYEIYLISQKSKQQRLRKNVKIPEFKQGVIGKTAKASHIITKTSPSKIEKNKPLITTVAVSIAIILMGGFAVYRIYSDLKENIKEEKAIEAVPIPTSILDKSEVTEEEGFQTFDFGIEEVEPTDIEEASEEEAYPTSTDTPIPSVDKIVYEGKITLEPSDSPTTEPTSEQIVTITTASSSSLTTTPISKLPESGNTSYSLIMAIVALGLIAFAFVL